MTIEEFNRLDIEKAKAELKKCCGSSSWVNNLMKHFPFHSVAELKINADAAWSHCRKEDFLEAFSHHPKIGEKKIEKIVDGSRKWAEQEQSGVKSADERTVEQLHTANVAYEKKNGFIFIVCATGKTAAEMLSLLNERMNNDTRKEIEIAAREQHKITHLRIDKLFA